MKKTPFLGCFAAAGLAALFGATTASADIVYVSGCISNCVSTATCGSGINTDVNPVLFVGVYQDGFSAYTSAKASGTGVADKPITPGSRYFSNSFSNSTPDNCIILSPSLMFTGSVYRIDHTYSSTAGNVSSNILVGLTNISGCTLSVTNTDKFQSIYGNGPNSWSTIGYVTNNPDSSNPQIGLYFVGGNVNAGISQRMEIDCFRFVLAQPCLAVAQPSLTGPLAAGVPTVMVTGVLSNATNVAVWQDTGSGMVKLSSVAATNPATTVAVPVTGLVVGAKVGSSQTVGGVESCPPTAGTLVGTGPNTSLRIALSVRGNPNLAGPIWTTGGGTNSNVYYIGASDILSGAGPGDDTLIVYPSNTWQTLTFQRGTDPFNPVNPTVLWNNGNAGTPEIEGDYGSLDGIAFACNGDPGNFDVYIDQISNGTNGVVENYEGIPAGTSYNAFGPPGNSGTTSGFLLSAPNVSTIVTGVSYDGTNSTHVQWQFIGSATNQWMRLAHSAASTNAVANPQFNLNEPLSFKLLLLPPGQPARPGKISFSHSGNNLILNWVGSFPLQSATNLTTSGWTDVGPNTGPYTNAIGSGALYFRLRNNF